MFGRVKPIGYASTEQQRPPQGQVSSNSDFKYIYPNN